MSFSTRPDVSDEKNGVPPPPLTSPEAAYEAAFPNGNRTPRLQQQQEKQESITNTTTTTTVTQSNVNVRTSNSSLPPTRVSSPRPNYSHPRPLVVDNDNPPIRSPSVVSSSAGVGASDTSSQRTGIPASRGSAGLTPHGSRPPVPTSRGPHPQPNRLMSCFKPPQTPSSIFDLQLTSLVDTYKRLPAFLDLSIEYLCQHLDESSEFFTPVSELKLQDYINYLEDAGEGEIQLASIGYYGVSAIGGFLKRFLDTIPEPLLTYTRYEQFNQAANFTPIGGDGSSAGTTQRHVAGGIGALSPHSPSPALRQSFPVLTLCDEHDQRLLLQSLVISLPGAHFLLLERLVNLLKRIVDYTATMSPSPHVHGVSLQRLSLTLSHSILTPRFEPGSKGGESHRRAQEQQVLIYLVQHYDAIFHTNPIRLLSCAPQGSTTIIDPNPELETTLTKWRHMAGRLKLNFSRRHFDVKILVKAFRGWRGTIKTNRRRAEAYRQLALLKQELLEEKQKNVLLSRELYGLKEEYELRDFQDQLRIQTGAIKAHGLGVQSTTTTTNQTIARTSGVAPPVTTTKYLQRGYDEREVGAAASSYGGGIGGGVGPQSHRAFTGVIHQPPPSSASYGGGAPLRDISQDIAAVRALQEQDRILTQAYSSRY